MLPFNIASYALLLHMIAQVTNHVPEELVGNLTNVHIYNNHIEQVKEQIDRGINGKMFFTAPKLSLNKSIKKIDDFTYDDIEIYDYNSFGKLTAPMAV